MGGAGVGEDDDGGFEALGAMDCHDAHFTLRAGEFALHLAATTFDGIEKQLQAGWLVAVEAGSAIDQGGDWLARWSAEAREDELPSGLGEAVAAFQRVRQEFVGWLMRAGQHIGEEGANGYECGIGRLAERIP